ncbi:MAG: hypothetical protein ACO1OF_16270 [Adhaeribacter sp.]
MRTLLLLFAFLLQVSLGYGQAVAPARSKATTTKPAAKKQQAPKVYICEGGSAYAYHSSEGCSGLNRCTHTITAVSVADAENKYSRRPCKKCY